jgi:MFS family permease
MSAAPVVEARPSTFRALRNANFRLYFAGQLVSASGTWMQNVAQGFLVFQITQSERWLGIVACAAGLPLLVLSPIAGVIVERFPRREMMLFTQTAQMILAFILSALTFSNTVQVWHIVVLALLLGVSNTLDTPARLTLVTEMVGLEDLPSGIALNSILNSGSRVLGPAAAGIALKLVGPAWCFFINGTSFLAVIASLALIKVLHPIHRVGTAKPIQQLMEGLSFARRHALIAPLLILTAEASLFGVTIVQLLPAFASVVLHSPTDGYAALATGQGIGSVLAGLVFGWLAHRLGKGRLIAVMVALAGTSTLLFSMQVTIPLAALFSTLSGFFLVLQVVTTNTVIQSVVPNEYRGRVLSLYSLAFFGLAPFGALVLGLIAEQIGNPGAIALYAVLGGLMGGWVLWRWPNVVYQA